MKNQCQNLTDEEVEQSLVPAMRILMLTLSETRGKTYVYSEAKFYSSIEKFNTAFKYERTSQQTSFKRGYLKEATVLAQVFDGVSWKTLQRHEMVKQ